MRNQPQLVDIARRIHNLQNMTSSIYDYLLSFFNYDSEASTERTESYLRLSEQMRTEIDRINGTLQGLQAPKPTSDDIVNGRCIDTKLMVIN